MAAWLFRFPGAMAASVGKLAAVTTVVFLGDNMHPDGVAPKTVATRDTAFEEVFQGLEAILASSRAPDVVVVAHHPPRTNGRHGRRTSTPHAPLPIS